MSAVLSRWRAQFSESDTTEGGSAGPWLSKVLVGRTAAALFWLCGASSLASLVRPTTSGGQPSGAYVAAAVAAGAGLLAWWLPWSRWPRWASSVPDPGGIRAGRGPERARGLRRRRLQRLLRAALRLDRRRLSAGDGAAGSDPVRGRVRAAPGLPGTALGDGRGLCAVRGRGLPPRRRDPGLAVDDAAPQPGRPLASPRRRERHRRRTCLHGRPGDALVVDRAALERACGPARLGRLPADGRRRARLSRERLRREALPRAAARVHGAGRVGASTARRSPRESRSSSPRPPIRASARPSARTCAAGGSRRCSSCRWSPGTR